MYISGQFHTPAALLPGNELQYAVDMTLRGPRAIWSLGRNEKFLPSQGIEIQVVDTVGNHSIELFRFINNFRLLAENANAKKKKRFRNYVSIFIFRIKKVATS
jgi:hypothetical protein